MPSPSDPDLWTIDPADYDPRDVVDDDVDFDESDENECEICHEACPHDQVVCDECEQLVDEMNEEESDAEEDRR